MPPRKAKKATSAKSNTAAAEVARVAKKEAESAALVQWLEQNDPLYDRSGDPPITVSELLSTKLSHNTFSVTGKGEMPYNWDKFRGLLEARKSDSPRWFMQLREEDLLADDGFTGVTVDCVVIAEASVPTLAPAHYIVKMHMPFSDLEDNAPERILPIEGQGMCWRRVVRDNGCNINAYLLQKRGTPSGEAPVFGFGAAVTAAPSTATANSTSVTNSSSGFGFGATPSSSSNGPSSFGFGAAAASVPTNTTSTATPPSSFGFGFSAAAPASVNASNFGFGASTNGTTSLAAPVAPLGGFGSQSSPTVTPLKTSEVLFALWSKKRLSEMTKSLKSGSRVLREDFKPSSNAPTIKLVMQNDLKDDVCKTVKQLILNKIFAKRCTDILDVDHWIDSCPVYDAHLTAALQKFRAHHVQKVAESSDEFEVLYDECHKSMEAELNRIVELRKAMVQQELGRIEEIMTQLKEGKLAEKRTFRLLKYYAANDVMRFRPFGKVSGISEMGESADVCEPPAPVLVNPFMALRSAASA
ncbi:hypothetical protein TraAM80_01085 [Trypanosoma rangeli]|uniref:Nucleoporin n=1 Tax=Trypanosoma rangeli TaxID=5698 RepID=A0A3R7NSX9_TRYRA|nr:uncharacterized protein TraAM80_01085 [Trypanosoma rangeli]RNF11118.1 hypothetical protein TraAM80_01085 [Trypanosoma rangeli]|eukprot:RNF11118.1 hypothetical protein TraAM80_01085 [Trypanosoma rangeli]